MCLIWDWPKKHFSTCGGKMDAEDPRIKVKLKTRPSKPAHRQQYVIINQRRSFRSLFIAVPWGVVEYQSQQTTWYLHPWAWKHSDKTHIVCALSDTCRVHRWVKGHIYYIPLISVLAGTFCNFLPVEPNSVLTSHLSHGSRLAGRPGCHFSPTFFTQY